jgi:hypothetical protein
MRLTKRGRAILIYLPGALALLYAIIWVSGHVWYTGDGYCIGTMLECFSKEFTR